MATENTPPTTTIDECHFFKLPRELRDMIYVEVCKAGPIYVREGKNLSSYGTWAERTWFREMAGTCEVVRECHDASKSHVESLMGVCQLIRREAAESYHKELKTRFEKAEIRFWATGTEDPSQDNKVQESFMWVKVWMLEMDLCKKEMTRISEKEFTVNEW